MHNHVPPDYRCVFCLIAQGLFGGEVWTVEADIVFRDDSVTALISPEQWPRNPGHVLIVPNAHYENLYDLPLDLGTRIHEVSRRVAVAMKAAYACEGISTRQHNEPAANQEVFHYHLHVFPRYKGDELYKSEKSRIEPQQRARYAEALLAELGLEGLPEPAAFQVGVESAFTVTAQSLLASQKTELDERYGKEQVEAFDVNALRGQGSAFVVARLAGQPVGCGALCALEEKTAELLRMYVVPHVRRRGLSRQILASLETEAREFGYSRVRLEAGVLQPEAIALYESAGFRRIPRFGRWVNNPASLCYEKDLQ